MFYLKLIRNIILTILLGGILGFALGYMNKNNFLNLGFLNTGLTKATMQSILAGTILGILVIGFFILRISRPRQEARKNLDTLSYDQSKNNLENDNINKLLIREERIDISKEKVEACKVDIHKEIIHEEKSFTIPVSREELVIEKKNIYQGDVSEKDTEVIRIPLSQEQVDISKSLEVLNDVSVHKNQYEDTKHIDETIRKEILKVDKSGDVNITYAQNKKHL